MRKTKVRAFIEEETRRELRRERTIEVLKVVALGALVSAAFIAPNIIQLGAYFDLDGSKGRRRLQQKLAQLKRSGFLSSDANGNLSVSKKGQRLLTEEEVWDKEPHIPTRWDGQWHLVLFDIPVRYDKQRKALRARLDDLGFVLYQNSVFVHWVNARDVVAAFAAFYGLTHFVKFGIAKHLDGEEILKKKLKPKLG